MVELMSHLNIDEFQMNQWMFMFDGFGIQYQGSDDASRLDSRSSQQRAISSHHEGGTSPDGTKKREIFQPYMIKFMCHSSTEEEETEEKVFDRFVVYSRSMDTHLEVEKNFEDCVPTEVIRPLFISDSGLKGMIDQQGKREFVLEYAKKLQ